MKKIDTRDAVGKVLGHDVTKIIPGSFKGVAFSKGHVITEKDVDELMDIGKYSIYVMEMPPGHIHEDEAGIRLARAFAEEDLRFTGPKEGKVAIAAPHQGLLQVRPELVTRVNLVEGVMLSTLHTLTPVEADETVAAARIHPLTIDEKVILDMEELSVREGKIIRVLPYLTKRIGALVTGTEIVEGRIRDGFDEAVGRRIERFGQTVRMKLTARDDRDEIASKITALKQAGMEIITITAGLSVDPDDATVAGVKQAGAKIVFYGSPLLPGAMFLYAKLDGTDVLGLPACVFYHATTAFDVFFPRILAGLEITPQQVAEMGHGGFCRNCPECRYPNCAFAKV